jgi:serine/threonine protein kinase
VKPENVFVDGDGSARLADFDVSKDDATRVTMAVGTLVGRTMRYVSPELRNNASAPVTTASDIYAFGLTTFDVCTADVDHNGNATLTRDNDTTIDVASMQNDVGGAFVAALCARQSEQRPTATAALAMKFLTLAILSRNPGN